jgi:branched-chain amino acid transport system substrate-binding protein
VMRARLLLIVVALAALASACTKAEAERAYTVGAIYPRTGVQGDAGNEEARGVELAAEWSNAHGGVHGRPIRLREVNTVRPEAVPTALRDLKAKGVTTVIGSHGSALSAAAGLVATEENMSFWETGAVGQLSPKVAAGRNFFRMSPMGGRLGSAAIDFVRDRLGRDLGVNRPLRYSVAYVDDAYGRAVGGGALDQIRASGQTLAGSFRYDAAKTDFTNLAVKIAAARTDVLFVAAYLDDGIALRRAVIAQHVPLLASLGTSSSYCAPDFGEALGADAVGLFASDKPDAANVRLDTLKPEARQALVWARTQYQKRWHDPMPAPALSGFSNGVALFHHVLPAATSDRPADLAAAGLKVKLPRGTLANGSGLDLAPPTAKDPGTNRATESVIWEWTAPEHAAVVWPPAMATHPVDVVPVAR